MTAKHSFSLYEPTARGRIRVFAASAAIVLAIGAAFGVSSSRASVGSVYFDANQNVGAGDNLFGGTIPGGFGNVGVSKSVMPGLTSGGANTGIGYDSLLSLSSGNGN